VFEGLINEAETAADAVVTKYAVRATVVVPFLVALVFATLAITFLLVDRFGAIPAFLILTLVYGAVGTCAALSVTKSERKKAESRTVEQEASTKSATTQAAAAIVADAPLAIAATLLSSLGGPTVALDATKAIIRNWPLVVLAGLVGVLVFSTAAPEAGSSDAEVDPDSLNGARAPSNGVGAPLPQATF
jgi:hypothetical protein